MRMIDYEDDEYDEYDDDAIWWWWYGDDFDGVGTVDNRMCLLKMMIYSQLSEDEW